jgi:NAD(P)H dehydrogenase (quinone)
MIIVTGASGKLGRLTIEALADRGVPAGQIVAGARDLGKVSDLAERGFGVRVLDYDQPATVEAALEGAERVLLISSSEVGQRVDQHRNVIAAAVRAGVAQLAYTSILNVDRSGAQLAVEHRATEELVRAYGVPHALLRNSWYIENYTENLDAALGAGAFIGSAGEGRVAAATRADLAQAAAAVLTAEPVARAVFELAGEGFTMAELAAEVSAQTGRALPYQDLPPATYAEVLVGAGVPGPFAEILADSDQAIARGDLDGSADVLASLIGRRPTPLSEAVASALR